MSNMDALKQWAAPSGDVEEDGQEDPTSQQADIVGSPFDEHNQPSEPEEEQKPEAQAEGQEPVAAEAEPVAEEPAKPVFEGLNKTLASQEELVAYTRELEKQTLMAEAEKLAKATEEVKPEEPKFDIDAFVENPTEVLTQYKNDAKREIQEMLQQERTNAEAERKFYEDYRDLEPFRDVVDLVSKRDWNELSKLPKETISKELANRSRQ